jgi:hypothetical protein
MIDADAGRFQLDMQTMSRRSSEAGLLDEVLGFGVGDIDFGGKSASLEDVADG